MAVGIVVQLGLHPDADNDLLFGLFYPSVIVAAILGGLASGLAATTLSLAFVLGFHVLGQRAWPLDPVDLLMSVGFTLGGLVLVGIIVTLSVAHGRLRRRRAAVAAEAATLARRHSIATAELAHRDRLVTLLAEPAGGAGTLPTRALSDVIEGSLARQRARIDVRAAGIGLMPEAVGRLQRLLAELLSESSRVGALSDPAGRVTVVG
ncbi:MAG: hypothetical protein U1E23_05100 [Reyranellaceae bacterium]